MVAGAVSSAANALTEHPKTRGHPTTLAMASSMMLFCSETKQPVGVTKGAMSCVAHRVS